MLSIVRKPLAALILTALLVLPRAAAAHCDTVDGPVVSAARLALKNGDVTPVLKWVKPQDEAQIRAAFARTAEIRALSPAARELADNYFFETLVRVHRAGEGAPYSGLKPAGTEAEPGIAAADRALDSGSADELVKQVTAEVANGIRQRFATVQKAAQHADHNVAAGREYVAAYVEFIHYVERLHQSLGAAVHAHEHAQLAEAEHH